MNKDNIRSNKDKYKVLHMEKYNPGEQHRLGICMSREQLYGKGPGGPGGQAAHCERTVSLAAAKKANTRPGCINTRRDEVTTLLSSGQATPGILSSVLVPAIHERCGQDGEGTVKGQQ